VRGEEEVEKKKKQAEAKRKALEVKIVELHKMLSKESAEAKLLQKKGASVYFAKKSALPSTSETTHTPVTARKPMVGVKLTKKSAKKGSVKVMKHPEKVEGAVKNVGLVQRGLKKGGGHVAAEGQAVAWRPAAKVMAPGDHTSAQALKRGLLVAEKVMTLMAQRKEARIEARHPHVLQRKAEHMAADKERTGSRKIIAAAIEEHAAGLNLSPGQAGEEEFGAFA